MEAVKVRGKLLKKHLNIEKYSFAQFSYLFLILDYFLGMEIGGG